MVRWYSMCAWFCMRVFLSFILPLLGVVIGKVSPEYFAFVPTYLCRKCFLSLLQALACATIKTLVQLVRSKMSYFRAQFIICYVYVCTILGSLAITVTGCCKHWTGIGWISFLKFILFAINFLSWSKLHHSMPSGFRWKQGIQIGLSLPLPPSLPLSLWYYCSGIWKPCSWFVGDALISFRTAIISSDGVLLQWRPEDPDPCGWKGVQCDPKTNRVIALWVWSQTCFRPFGWEFFVCMLFYMHLSTFKLKNWFTYQIHRTLWF